MNYIKILSPGLLTTVQDKGRAQLQHLGIPGCGAMDMLSLATANVLVGNEQFAAALECTWSGPVVQFMARTQIALAGAATEAKLNGFRIPMYTTIIIEVGDVLDLTAINQGARLYLAIAGGINVPNVLDSRSTYMPIQFGSLDRRLKADDELPLSTVEPDNRIIRLAVDSKLCLPNRPQDESVIHLVPGPQLDYFSEAARAKLTQEAYTLNAQSDRMGLRFDGPVIELANTKPMISDGIPLGSMQITRGGQPIIMMADRQPTGGYPKIAKVMHTDIPILAQLRPQNKVRFVWATLDEARERYLEIQQLLGELASKRAMQNTSLKAYRIYINNTLYQTSILEEISEK